MNYQGQALSVTTSDGIAELLGASIVVPVGDQYRLTGKEWEGPLLAELSPDRQKNRCGNHPWLQTQDPLCKITGHWQTEGE